MKNTKPKKTIIISSYDDLKNPYYGGGGAMVIHETAKRLVKDFNITVLTGSYPGSKNEVSDGVRYKRIGIKFVGPKLSQLTFQIALLKYVARQNYDVWIESFTPPFSTSFLPLFTSRPVIGLIHMLAAEDMKRKYLLPFDLVEKVGLKLYDNFIVQNKFPQEKIQKENKKARIAYIPSGAEIKKNLKSKNSHILFLGRIEVNQKGLDLLLSAYSLIKNEIKEPLYIAGAGLKKDEKKLKKLIRQLKLENKVKLMGRVEGNKKEELIKNSLFVTIPSRFETFSVTAMEAMSYKKAMIGFDIPGLDWVSKKNMVKVKPFEVKKLSMAILNLVKDKKLRSVLSKNGHNSVRKYSWEKSTSAYKKVINEVFTSYGKIN